MSFMTMLMCEVMPVASMHGLVHQSFKVLALQNHTALLFRRSLSRNRTAICAASKDSSVNLSETRGVLRLAGPDLVPFLQGLLTNDVKRLTAPGDQILYAALLNAQGRHLHDLFLHKNDQDGAVILADVDKAALPDLKRKLMMYKLRSAVDIAEVSDEYEVRVDMDTDSRRDSRYQTDPRLPILGARAVLPREQDSSEADSEGQREFKRLRLQHGVAEGDTEMPHGQAVPLEYNMDGLNAISYTKGCYVGQELIARTHHKGVVRKRLMPVTISGGGAEEGAGVSLGPGDAEIGKIRAIDGDLGLAHVRLKPVINTLSHQAQLHVGDAKLTPSVPSWWPSTWGHEE